ncbi:inactive TPR repeat-containing thioredoxin TTL3 isoform X1 [Cannabis sativa]|uniref:inactive TPR repeat-containing thioredoxin TTL3 isoform X1 n=1 Tax=Cannabis sativa TaxID=3483 RepID=UPI0029CA4F26|nr:inactive TPR repeat-containing thioredoxin TTL3 isoform X1 [Cannabis sativa]
MAEIANYRISNEFGCGFMSGIFNRWSHWSKKSPAVHSLTSSENPNKPNNHGSHKNRSTTSPEPTIEAVMKLHQKPTRNSVSQRKIQGRRISDAARSSTSSSKSNGSGEERKLRIRESTPNNSLQLARVNDTKALSKTSTTNININGGMVLGHNNLGNLKQPLSNNTTTPPTCSSRSTILALSKSLQVHQEMSYATSKNGYGNIVRNNSDEFRGISNNKLEPEALKRMGNEAYKEGRFKDALALYNRAIALDSSKAAYHSNKSAALIGLGRLIEAICECNEAIRIDPSYHRAHHRLGTLYLRLGQAEKALYYYKQSGPYTNTKDTYKAEALERCLLSCDEARKLQNWNTLLTETQFAISSGANSAPLLFTLQAEALFRLLRHEEAYAIYQKGANFSIDVCTNFFGMPSSAYRLMIGSQVYLASGRFDDAVVAAEEAAKLDPNNKEIMTSVKRAKAVSSARSTGNLLFKAEKYSHACVVYSQGLEQDPYNSVLLCNRAACRAKLIQFEKAIEDCTAALVVQPSYSKARLRRADSNAKLERWEAAIQDYEFLIREMPGNEEVGRALFEAKIQLERQHGEDIKDMKLGSNLVSISSTERFRHIVTSPGMCVVLFCNKAKQKRVFQALEQVCKRFPSVNFLKVEVEDYPYLVKTEGVTTIPTFKIYKNGSRVQEIPGNNHELLENSVKWYSSTT